MHLRRRPGMALPHDFFPFWSHPPLPSPVSSNPSLNPNFEYFEPFVVVVLGPALSRHADRAASTTRLGAYSVMPGPSGQHAVPARGLVRSSVVPDSVVLDSVLWVRAGLHVWPSISNCRVFNLSYFWWLHFGSLLQKLLLKT